MGHDFFKQRNHLSSMLERRLLDRITSFVM